MSLYIIIIYHKIMMKVWHISQSQVTWSRNIKKVEEDFKISNVI